jgi:N-hydroxyarylamine O-acetyltransferase
VTERRGGYCFEHNLLFRAVLETLGFETTGLAARVLWDRPAGAMPARTHMTLLVETGEETWLADVGFGGMTPSAPLPFETGCEQATPHETFRIALIDRGDYMLQVKLNGAWKPIYRFDLEPQFPSDYEAANHFVSTFPDSIFISTLMAARLTPGRRYALRNRHLTCHGAAQTNEPRELASVAELRAALTGEFGLTLPDADGSVSSAELDALLARLAQTAA